MILMNIYIFVFSQSRDLKKHMKWIHSKQKDHKCPQCDKAFSTMGLLNRHIRTVHECDECDKSFGDSGMLKKHIKFVHGGLKRYKHKEIQNQSSRRPPFLELNPRE